MEDGDDVLWVTKAEFKCGAIMHQLAIHRRRSRC